MPPVRKRTPARKQAAKPKPTPRVLGTRVKITLDQSRGRETLTLQTPAGQTITLSDAHASIRIADGNGNTITLDPAGITIQAASRVTLSAAELRINATSVRVQAGASVFSGVVQCDTLVANSVVSASYTPGAGNIL